MKKVVLLDEHYDIFSTVEFDDEDFFKHAEKVVDAPDIDYQELIDLISSTDYGIDVLIPTNDGEDFIVKDPATTNNILLNFMDIQDPESINDRIFDEVFPVLSEVGSSHIFKKTYKTGNPHSCKLQLYDNKDELLRSYKLKAVKFQNTVILLTKDDTNFCLLYRKEEDLFHESLQGMIVIQDGKIVRVNRPFAKMIDCTVDELQGSSFNLNNYAYEELTVKEWEETFQKLLNGDLLFHSGIIRHQNQDGTNICFISNATPVLYKNKPAVQISSIEVTETRKDKRQIFNLKKDLEKILGINNIAIMYWDSTNNFRWSGGIYDIIEEDPILFNSKSNLINKYVIEEDKNRIKKLNKKAKDEYSSFDTLSMMETSDGTIKNVAIYVHYFPPDKEGNPSAVGYVQDITKVSKLVRREVELKEHLNEKDVLLQEVHHRVRNNLQIILSLLNLDLRFSPEDPQKTIRETRNRIKSMALIHEKLYESSDYSHVNIREYLLSTVDSLFSLYDNNIKYIDDLDDINISMDKAIPIGLILNEIINNAVKYAFPDGEKGELIVKLKESGNNITLIIGDNGVGLPDDMDIHTSPTLGFTVINNLVSQISGRISKLDKPGTYLKIEFPN